MLWIRLFLPFAGAYFLSYHFRTANAVVGPVLSEEFSLGAADLGLLTSTYFFVFGAAQRAQAQPVAVRVGLHHPFAATGAN